MRFLNGDVTEAPEEFIAHGCNAQGVMGSGVAKAIRAKWPGAYQIYRALYEGTGRLPLGTVQWYDDYVNDKVIINCITQEFYGYDGRRYASPEAIKTCLDKIATALHDEDYDKPVKIAIPWIGCGLGGLNKNELIKIVGSVESRYPGVEFILYEYEG